MWKSRIDSKVRDFQPLKKQFAPWTFFLGGGGMFYLSFISGQ